MAEPDGIVIPQRRTLLGGHDLVHDLVHIATPYRTEWRSLCGFDFLSYQTTLEDRVVTCVWCVTGATRRVRFGFADTGLRNPCAIDKPCPSCGNPCPHWLTDDLLSQCKKCGTLWL